MMNYGKREKQQKVFNLAKWYESVGGRAIHIDEMEVCFTGEVSDNKNLEVYELFHLHPRTVKSISTSRNENAQNKYVKG